MVTLHCGYQELSPACTRASAVSTSYQIGQSAVVDHLGGGRQVSRRLMEMGLLPGTRVETIRRAPLGDPLKIRLRGYLLSLRLADAAQIALAPGAPTGVTDASVESVAAAYRFPPHVERSPSPTRVPRVLVAGNANSGKTTIFNALTGARAYVSNYPSVTVTRSSRRVALPDGSPAEIIDLPGTYSLTAHSPDEQVAVDAVHGRHGDRPDVVVVVVDAGALERGLYLVLQIVETGVPVVVALNMIDEASAAGADFDISRLAGWFGTIVVPTVASKGKGLDELRDAVAAATRVGPRDDAAWTGCQGRSKIRPPWRRKTRPLGSWVEWRNAAVRRGRQDAGVAAGWRAFLLCSRR